MLESVFFLPLLTGLIALFLPVKLGRIVLVVTALLHLQLTVLGWLRPARPDPARLFRRRPRRACWCCW